MYLARADVTRGAAVNSSVDMPSDLLTPCDRIPTGKPSRRLTPRSNDDGKRCLPKSREIARHRRASQPIAYAGSWRRSPRNTTRGSSTGSTTSSEGTPAGRLIVPSGMLVAAHIGCGFSGAIPSPYPTGSGKQDTGLRALAHPARRPPPPCGGPGQPETARHATPPEAQLTDHAGRAKPHLAAWPTRPTRRERSQAQQGSSCNWAFR